MKGSFTAKGEHHTIAEKIKEVETRWYEERNDISRKIRDFYLSDLITGKVLNFCGGAIAAQYFNENIGDKRWCYLALGSGMAILGFASDQMQAYYRKKWLQDTDKAQNSPERAFEYKDDKMVQ